MNILNIVFSFQSGGIENLLVDTLNCWPHAEDQQILCVVNHDYNPALLQRLNREKIELLLLEREKKTGLIRPLCKIRKALAGSKIDIIHCHNMSAVKFAVLYKLMGGTGRIVYTVHDTQIASCYSALDVCIINIAVKQIVAISEAVRKDILGAASVRPGIMVVHNGIDFKRFEGVMPACVPVKTLGMIARIVPEKKGQELLIRAMEKVISEHPEISVIFAGEFPDDGGLVRERLMKAAEENGVTKHIHFLGNVNDIPGFMSSIDALILPSYYEGFGIVLIEAMAGRRPVIASDLEGPREIIGDDKYGQLFPKGDAEALSNAIIDLVENGGKDVNIVYEYALTQYSIQSACCKLRDTYMNVKK